jgi:hypothetical protein
MFLVDSDEMPIKQSFQAIAELRRILAIQKYWLEQNVPAPLVMRAKIALVRKKGSASRGSSRTQATAEGADSK